MLRGARTSSEIAQNRGLTPAPTFPHCSAILGRSRDAPGPSSCHPVLRATLMLKHGVATKRTILAMILTGFSRSIVNVQCLDSSGTAHVSGLSEAASDYARLANAFDWPRWQETRF